MSLRILTTGPVVTELPLALEPVEPDPFLHRPGALGRMLRSAHRHDMQVVA